MRAEEELPRHGLLCFVSGEYTASCHQRLQIRNSFLLRYSGDLVSRLSNGPFGASYGLLWGLIGDTSPNQQPMRLGPLAIFRDFRRPLGPVSLLSLPLLSGINGALCPHAGVVTRMYPTAELLDEPTAVLVVFE